MKSVEFKSTVAPDGQIPVPPEVARQIPAGEQLQIVVLWETPTLDDGWSALGRRQFEAAYAPEDSVYEHLMDDASTMVFHQANGVIARGLFLPGS